MPHEDYEPDELVEREDEDDEDDDDEGDDEPTAVFVSMTPGRVGADEAMRTITGASDRKGLDVQRFGGEGGAEALYEMVETSDFAIIDVSNTRPGLAGELECIDHEIAPELIAIIARSGSPRPPELEGRAIEFYSDQGDLRALVKRRLNAMIDAWHEGAEVDDIGGDGDDEDE